MKDEVIEFILRRFPINCYWLNGNCYYFALILHDRFPGSSIYYNPIDGHFVTKVGNNYYDWHGIYIHTNNLIEWEKYKEQDLAHYFRIKRDVID